MNCCTAPSAMPSCCTAAARSSRSSARNFVTSAACSLNWFTASSLAASAEVNFCRLSTVANRSSSLPDSVFAICDSCVTVSLSACAVAVGVLREGVEQVRERAVLVHAVRAERDADPVEARVQVVDLERGRGALLAAGPCPRPSSAPPVYAGVNCTYRSLTSDGATITALAVAGSRTVPVDQHVDADRVAVRRDLVDVADLHPEDPHVVVLVQADDAGEHGRVAPLVALHQQPPQEQGDDQRQHDRDGHAASEVAPEPGSEAHDCAPMTPLLVDRTERGRHEPADVVVEPAPVADRVVEQPDERRHVLDALAERVLVALQHAGQLVEARPAPGRAARCCRRPGPVSSFASAWVPSSNVVIASRRRPISSSSRLPSCRSLTTSASRSASVPLICLVLSSSVASCWSRVEIVFDSACRPVSAPLHVVRGVGERVGDDLEALRELRGVDRVGGLGEPTERLEHVVRRGRCGPSGWRCDGSSTSRPSGSSARYFWPSTFLILMAADGLVADPGVLDLERHHHAVAVQLDVGHLADLHPGDAHLVVRTRCRPPR